MSPVAALTGMPRSPLAVLIGPEGGFAEDERNALLKLPNVVRISLGPRILRADTAAVAALTLGSGSNRRLGIALGLRALVNDVPAIHADKGDVVAISAVHACHLRQAPPMGAIAGRHFAIFDEFDVRLIGHDAAGIVTVRPWKFEPRARAEQAGSVQPRQCRHSTPRSLRQRSGYF